MGNLFDLIAGIAPAPAVTTTTPPLIEVAPARAANDPHPASEPQQAPAVPTPAPAAGHTPEATSEPTRSAWRITREGRPIGYIVGQPMTHSEALAEARWRWPDANILEN